MEQDTKIYALSEKIVNEIGFPALFENLAEECCELGHASLKFARRVRGENVTPTTSEEAYEHLIEECGDVITIIHVLMDLDPEFDKKVYYSVIDKRMRWIDRLTK